MEACKVAGQLLQAIVQLADMHLWHGDLSVNNFILDERLNVQIIDLGDVRFGLEDEDFQATSWPYLPFQEYQMSPELAAHLACHYPAGGNWRSQVWYYIPHDIRHQVLWKFGVILYGILHGFWPWDTPPRGGHREDLLDYDGNFHNGRVHTRRWNIINRDLPIDANLSQDCRDVLQAMFSKHPGDRPTLPKLMTFPWFSKWVDEDQRFWRRPYSKAFQMDSWQQK